MRSRTILATTGTDLIRATEGANGDWMVQPSLSVRCFCLAVDPLRPGVVYAGTGGTGVLRSDDGGVTWRSAGLEGRIVKALSVSRVQSGTVYAGVKPAALYVSHNGGTDWIELEALRRARRWFWRSPAESDLLPYVQAIGLSPVDANVIIAGIEAGVVLRSDDGGESWSSHLTGALRDCHSLMFHARDGGWVYEAGGTGAGAAVSRDGGQSWMQPKQGLDRHYGWAVAADPEHPDRWYVSASPLFTWARPGPPAAHVDGAAGAYIFRYQGNGPWQKLGGGLPQPLNYMAYGLVTDAEMPGHIYAGLSSGDVWHSVDHGDHWEKLPFHLPAVHRSMVLL